MRDQERNWISQHQRSAFTKTFRNFALACWIREFYKKISKFKNKVHIIVKDDFLSFEEIGNLVFSSDKILLPYNLVDMSSGSTAYAAQFNKPVYVPSTGLLSKLVKKYKIGKVVDDFSDVSFLNDKIDINSNYCIDHTVEKFYKQLLSIK